MKKIKIKRRKNSIYQNKQSFIQDVRYQLNVENIINTSKNSNISVKFLNYGANAEVYYFELNKLTKIDGKILKSGKYVIKYGYNVTDSLKLILSKYGLSPKIYVAKKNYAIMKYIDGKIYSFSNLSHELNLAEKIKLFNKIKNQLKIWHNLDFAHGDLKDSNILISNDFEKIYLIDPIPSKNEINKKYDLNDLDIIRTELGIPSYLV